MTKWLLNGAQTDSLPISDRGLQYADGLFETIAVRDSKPRFLAAHLRRLGEGLRRLGIPARVAEPLEREVLDASVAAEDAVAKVIVTRGSGRRGYRPSDEAEPCRILGIMPATCAPREYYERGIVTRTCATPIALSPATAGIKALGRLEQVLARAEWTDPDVAEGLMLDPLGHIVSGTMTNFFCVRHRRLITPSLAGAGVAGIMRGVVIEQATLAGIEVVETRLRPNDLRPDDELFVTNSQIGLWPVRQIDDRSFFPGDPTRELMRRLAAVGVKECAL